MKKIIFLTMLFASIIAFKTEAQTSFTGTTTNPTGAILNATVDTLNLTMSGEYNKVMVVQLFVTRSSGTLAGTVRLYGSNFNVTSSWEPVGDTMTLTNAATNKHTWTLTEPGYKYYRALQDGGTTMAGIMAIKAVGLKPR